MQIARFGAARAAALAYQVADHIGGSVDVIDLPCLPLSVMPSIERSHADRQLDVARLLATSG